MVRRLLAAWVTITILGVIPCARAQKHLTLEPVDREPRQGRQAPSPEQLKALYAAVADKPDLRSARFDLVLGLIKAGEPQTALQEARKWRTHDAYNLVVVRLLGDIYSELGRHAEARRTYSAVVELLPDDAQAQRALAMVLKQSGQLSPAYQRLDAALRIRPDDVRTAFELADTAQRLGRHAEAIERFRTIVAQSNTPAKIRYPAKQRLAQLYAAKRIGALARSDSSEAEACERLIAELGVKGGAVNDIKVYLTWDTDRTDVDLWVINPRGERIYYRHKKGKLGGALYDDVTDGYGPESFTASKATPGTYVIKVHYYSGNRGAFSEARGEVVVILREGTPQEQRHVLPYRLFTPKQAVTVARVTVRS
jgi:hypothetical protein